MTPHLFYWLLCAEFCAEFRGMKPAVLEYLFEFRTMTLYSDPNASCFLLAVTNLLSGVRIRNPVSKWQDNGHHHHAQEKAIRMVWNQEGCAISILDKRVEECWVYRAVESERFMPFIQSYVRHILYSAANIAHGV